MLILLLLVPLIAGLLAWILPSKYARYFALISAMITAWVTSVMISEYYEVGHYLLQFDWIPSVGAHFSMGLSSWNVTFLGLAAVVYLLVFVWTFGKKYHNEGAFYALLCFSQIGITGVFLSYDALLFYLFWELALIPMYFLVARWGRARRIEISFKFFIYTFLGSVMMLVALFYMYYQHGQTFDWNTWKAHSANISFTDQCWLFALLIIGVGVKIPIFPLHSWQSETYKTAPKPVTVVLSALMSKMGIFAFIHWIMYMLPDATQSSSNFMIGLLVIGILYASLIAIATKSMVRILAFSSIAHFSLMMMGLFCAPATALPAVGFQIVSHGLVVMALWMIIDKIEYAYDSDMLDKIGGGLAATSPRLAIFFVFFAFANVGLPLTMNFVGEFILLKSIFVHSPSLMLLAGLSVIFGAIYMLRMLRMTLYGDHPAQTIHLDRMETVVLVVLVMGVVYFGIYPYPILEVVEHIPQEILP